MTKHVLPQKPIPEALWWRALRHSNGVGLGLLPVFLSIIVILTEFMPGVEPSLSLANIPTGVNLALASVLGTGGALAIAGLLWNERVISTGWTLERTGWLMVAGGWDGYAVTVLYYYPHSVFAWGIPAFLGLLALARAIVVWLIERILRPAAEEAKAIREGLEAGP